MKFTTLPGWVSPALKCTIGLSIVIWLVMRFNPAELIATLSAMDLLLICAALVVYALTLLVLALRWRFVLSRMGYQVPVWCAYQGFAAGILISDLTPARLGELSRPLTIRDRVPVPAGLGSVFLDRYCDFIALFILGTGGLLLLSAFRSPEIMIVMALLLTIPITILTAFWVRREWALFLIRKVGIRQISDFSHTLCDALDSLKTPGQTMGIALSLTLSAWFLQSLRLVLIVAAAGYIVPIQELVLIQPLISSLALLPISLSGLGIVEGGYVSLFTWYGIPAAAGLAIALLDRALTVGFHLIVGIRYALRTVGSP
ncbi:MAG TPA: lysylphosphatidylglycerol synthase transmembrane domain-containing protein [Methanospirillum sp.]|nr:lysylphosphatidylglycerol synthase transmembrane domain-containing protein [Methanospirillum sp.]